MPPLRLGPHDLLEYDGRYKVLICRECKYAIQKSALQSHLLRHKIYREERQQLLTSLAQLDIVEPHLVRLPTPDSPPVESLPTISGYRCLAVGCGSLCASSKRMRRHQSELHGAPESSNFSSLALPVNLQTFFRGTKLRYFEVSSSTEEQTAPSPPYSPNYGDAYHVHHAEEQLDMPMDDSGPTTSMPPLLRSNVQSIPSQAPAVDIDLDQLTCFHHFITTTSPTLPNTNGLASHYWQSNVVTQALARRWIMCGLLAIAACHITLLTEDTTLDTAIARRHRLVQLSSEFFKGRDEIVLSSMSLDLLEPDEETKRAGDRIACVLSCAQSALDAYTVTYSIAPASADRSQIQRIVSSLRYLVTCHISPDHDNNPGYTNDGEEENLSTSSSDDMLSGLLNRVRGLPFRMTEAFGRPESTIEVLEVLGAIGALIDSCTIAFKSAEPCAAWRGLAIWFTRVPLSFDEMVFQYNPPALVVLAHWAALLLKRAEQCGCWVLRGMAKLLMMSIDAILPAEDHAVRNLLAGLEHV